MQNIFSIKFFQFPYDYKFLGQASDERILFALRENKSMLRLRQVGAAIMAATLLIVGSFLINLLSTVLNFVVGGLMVFGIWSLAFGVFAVGSWWSSSLWKKSVCVVTTKRLIKFVFTTPFNKHSLSLPLDQVVDTGSYTKGFWQALLHLGTFTARSSAASSGVASDEEQVGQGTRLHKKYFYIENVAIAEDLQHYVNKLLEANKYQREHLGTFRPFIPDLKGERRKQFMQQYPEYWS